MLVSGPHRDQCLAVKLARHSKRFGLIVTALRSDDAVIVSVTLREIAQLGPMGAELAPVLKELEAGSGLFRSGARAARFAVDVADREAMVKQAASKAFGIDQRRRLADALSRHGSVKLRSYWGRKLRSNSTQESRLALQVLLWNWSQGPGQLLDPILPKPWTNEILIQAANDESVPEEIRKINHAWSQESYVKGGFGGMGFF